MLGEVSTAYGSVAHRLLSSPTVENRSDAVQNGTRDGRKAAAAQAANPNFKFPGANAIGFSPQMFAAFMQEMNAASQAGPYGGFANDELADIHDGIGEALDFAFEMDIGEGQEEEILKAADKLFQTIDRIEAEAKGQPLTEKQRAEIEKAEEAFHALVDDVSGAEELTPEEAKLIEKAEKTFEIAVDAIFKAAGDKPLTAAQEKQLKAAEEAFEKELAKVYGPPLSEAQEARLDKSLGGFEKILDQGFGKLGNKELSTAQEATLEKLEDRFFQQLEAVFKKSGAVTPADEKALKQAEATFKSSFDQLIQRGLKG